MFTYSRTMNAITETLSIKNPKIIESMRSGWSPFFLWYPILPASFSDLLRRLQIQLVSPSPFFFQRHIIIIIIYLLEAFTSA